MGKLKIYINGLLLILLCMFMVACNNAKTIIEHTNGTINTDAKPYIIFKESVIEHATKTVYAAYDVNDEIKINGKYFDGKYLFNKNNELTLIQNDKFLANTEYKIEFDFVKINKNTNSNIKDEKFTMEFKTNELIIDMPRGNFIKDSDFLDKIKLDAELEISQEIPFDVLKQNTKLLDSNKKEIEIDINQIDNKKFQVTSALLDLPKEKDEIYHMVFSKDIGSTKDVIVDIMAVKNVNLDIIDIKAISGNNTSIEIKFSNDLANNINIDNFIKISPDIKFSVSQASNVINIKGNFIQNKEYKIEILKGIKSQNNLELKDSYTKTIKIYDIAPKIVFSNEGVFLPDASKKKLAFRSINVKKANVVVKKIYANNITQFLGEKNLSKSNQDDNWIYNFDLMGDFISQTTIDINSPRNTWVQNEIDLNSIKDTTGIFIVELQFDKDDVNYTFPQGTADWKQRDYFYNNGRAYKQVIFSNIALIAQKYGNKIVASALDIRTNKPLNNITVQALSRNNQIVSTAITNKEGDAVLDFKGGEIPKETHHIVAFTESKNSNDLAILKLSAQKISEDGFDTDGISQKNGIKAFIYTDRGVYRPGDKININIIARNQDKAIEHPIKLTITNPKNKKQIDKFSLNPIGDGVFYYEFETIKNAETGIYNVSVDIGDNIFTHQLMVETVVPNRIKVEISAEDKIDMSKQKNIIFSVQSDYLFGSPASNLDYTINAHIYPKDFISKKYKDWIFDNPTNLKFADNKTFSGSLDDKGFIKNKIDLNDIKNINRNLEATIIARVFENNGRQVSNRKKISIKRFDSFVGIKNPQTKYIKKNEIVNIPVILIDEDEKPIAKRKLKYTVYNNNYSWWWDYDNYDNYMQSLKKDKNTKIIEKGEITTKNGINNISFEAKENGEILLEIEDISNSQSASIVLYASSWGEPLEADKITQLKIKSDKQEYRNNENAKITFESVKNGKALVVVSNNENILDRYWVKTNDKQTSINIKINEKYSPNLYVSVFLLQDYQNNDNDRSLRLYGVVPLKVINEKTRISLDIKAKDEILPNSNLTVEISNKEKKQVTYTLAVVDEGLINLTNFKTPSPWSYFYAKTKIGIESYDTYDYIIGKTMGKIEKTYFIGGGEESDIENSNNRQKDDSADRFKPVVFFIKPTKSDKNGYAKLTFKVPSYLGSLRIMLVAVDNNSYGSISKDVKVSAPVVMLPTIPRSLKINDNFNLPIEIMPIKDDVKNAKISISSSGIIEFSPKSQSVEFSNKKSKTLFFNGVVKEELGIENININLESNNFSMQDSTNIDIKAPNPYTLITKNYISNKGPLRIESPESIKNSSLGKITISASPILSIDHRLLWLIRYPYGCIEQTTSSVFPQLFIDKLSNANFIDKETIINNINAGISKIALFQTADGGFSYWAGTGSSDKWGSSYAGHFLIMAKNNGYYVNEELFKRWINYEIKQASATHENMYPIYLLALSNNVQLGIMNEIYENHLKKLTTTNKWMLAASYKIAGFDDIAKKIVAGLSLIPNEDKAYYEYTYGSSLRNKAIILQSYKTIYNQVNKDLYSSIKDELETNGWLSTQTTAYTLLTLADIKEETKNTKLEGKITINGKSQTFNETKETIVFTLNDGNALVESPNNLFVNYAWEGISVDKKGDNIIKNMQLHREFVEIDSYGNETPIDPRELKSSQSFYIKLKILPLDRPINARNVALTQNLPSGWEIENTRLNNDPIPAIVRYANEKITYTDIRDDKIMWFFDVYDKKTVYVKINTVTPGDYTLPPAYAEVMYDGGNYQASSDSFRVRVNAK